MTGPRDSRIRALPRAALAAPVVLALLVPALARAEPYLAIRTGLKCSACHSNLTGGGQRTAYGAGYGRQELPSAGNAAGEEFDGAVGALLRVGADLRAGAEESRPQDSPSLWTFDVFGAQLYGNVEVLHDRLSLHVDERIAPGTAASREAFALLRPAHGTLWVKVGQFFPPFGLRLQDDEAFTRAATGFNFSGNDRGVEVGLEPGSWSLAASVTNGSAGAAESNNGKQASFTGAFVHPRFRIGLTGARNDLPDDARRTLAGVFGGVRMGPVVLLAELDSIRERSNLEDGTADADASHVEADWLVARGVNLRVWGGRFDPSRDVGGDAETQAGLGVDWTMLPGIQLRSYFRRRDGPAAVPASNGSEGVVEVHMYF